MTQRPDYQTLDLRDHARLSTKTAGLADAPTGEQRFHGLPFLIGEGDRALIGLGPGLQEGPLRIPIGAAARNVLIAHRVLDSKVLEGGPVGLTVAEYVFHFVDGEQIRVPIRERFEIAMPLAWGMINFASVSDQKNQMQDRWDGGWGHAGERQTESRQGGARGYYLWCWPSPRPDAPIELLEIVPRDRRFVVAGITLGHADEHPFVREGAVPVRVELRGEQEGLNWRDIAIEVDRGVASYAQPLPAADAAAFLSDSFAGWGEGFNESGNPTYAEVAALPSATLAVKRGDETIESVRWGDVLTKGTLEGKRARVTIVEDGRNWVETTIVDDATGEPLACRVHFRSPAGVPYQPHGHHDHVNSNLGTWHVDVGGDLRLGQISYAYVDGRCQGWLPRGEMIVDVARGFEYEPLRERITIAPGQRHLELRLKRWTDMNAQRWFSGDTHVHFLSTVGSQREARGEDLNVVNLLLSQWGSLFTNTEEFTGEPLVSGDGRTIVWATQENRQHLLGHLTLLGLKKPVYPWCTDGPSEAEMGGALDTTLSHWADACRAQGGTVVLPHLPTPNGEPSTLIATGRVDAVEMIQQGSYQHLEYYRYLNAGYRLPLVGGTDKMSSEVAVGQYRTYVYVPPDEEFSYESWCRNMRLGRTFMSGGPLLELSVDGAAIGDTLRLPGGGGTVEVVARARSVLPVHTLQIVHNGSVIASSDEPKGARELTLRTRVRVDGNGWLCARAGGPSYEPLRHHDCWSRGIFAHTSPIYVACGGEWAMGDRPALEYMLTLVEGSLQYVRHLAPRRSDATTTHHHGEPDHLAYLERPFLEAREALHRRMHRVGVAH